MRLALKNIREHSCREFELPDRGLVQVRGDSGAGKTSLLDAVAFALFDNRRGLRTFHKSSCHVELVGLGLQLFRGKGPGVLRVNGYDGEPAQGEIERVIGMSEEEFMASSYLVQDLYGSLLSLPAAEQLRLISGLACGGEDPDLIKERIREQLKKHERQIARIEGQASSLAALRRELDAELAALPKAVDPAAGARLRERLAALEAEEESERGTGAELHRQLLATTERLADPRYMLRAQLEEAKAELLTAEAEAAQQRLAMAEAKAGLGPAWPSSPRAAVRRQIAELEAAVARADQTAEKRRRLERLASAHGIDGAAAVTPLALAEALAELAARLESELHGHELSLQAAERAVTELDLASHARHCPACATPLVLIDGELVRTAQAPADAAERRAALSLDQTRHASALKDGRSRLRKLHEDAAAARSLQGEADEAAGARAGEPPADPRAALAAARSYEETQLARDLAAAELEERRARLERDLAARRSAVARLSEVAGDPAALPPRAELEAERAKLAKDRAHWEASAARRAKTLADVRGEIRRQDDLNRAGERRRHLAAESAGLTLKLSACDADLAEARRALAAAQRLRELSEQAAADAASAIVNTLNVNAQMYLETLFPDTGTSVFLLTEKTLLNGDKRPKLALEILHKGCRYESLKELSGGERSRVNLAFQLALSDMYQSPLLMVDEGMKGLSSELKGLCLEALRAAARDKLVLVVEHGAPESAFDAVIDVAI